MALPVRRLARVCGFAVAASLLAITSAARAKPPAVATSVPADPVARLDRLLDSVRVARGVPGLAAAVIEHGRIVAIGAAGAPWAGAPRTLTVDDPMHIGSCTKSMTALAIARLVEQRRLQWSTTLVDAFPELMRDMLPPYRHVRLDQLLTHRAAIPPYESVDDDTLEALNHVERGGIADRHAFVRRVIQEAPVHENGARYDYSNAGYTLAAAMAENMTGKTWEYWMQELVFSPLNLKSAGFGWPADAHHPDRPRGHRCADSPNTSVTAEPLDTSYHLGPVLSPGGDVHLSITDLARYVAFQLDGAEGRATKPALKPETWRQLQQDPDGAASGYAMGWQLLPGDSTRPMLQHDGSAGTFYTRIVIWPERDQAIVIAANAGPPCGHDACEQGLAAVVAWLKRTGSP